MPHSDELPAFTDDPADLAGALMEITGEGLWWWDGARDRLHPSAHWYAATGLAPPASPPDRAWLFSHVEPRDRAGLEAAFQHCAETGGSFEREYRLRGPDGTVRWMRDRGRVLARGPDGRASGLIGSVTDITERRARENALREAAARFRSLADSVPAAIFRYILHPDGTDSMDYMSPGCEAIWEVGPDDIQSDPAVLWSMIVKEDVAGLRASIEASARDLAPWSHVWRVDTPSGRRKWLRGAGTPHGEPDGAILWNSLILDITDRIEAEETTRRAMEQAETANRAKTEFLAHMSHELRTPLNSIVGFSEIMQREMFGPHASSRYREYSAAIHNSASHLRTLLSDILDVSMIEGGDMPLNEAWLDMGETVGFCVELLRERLRRGGLTCDVALRAGAVSVLGDAVRIKQVLLNILSNAVKFTPADGRIVVEDRLDADGLHIVIRDTGIGIAPEDLPRVTEAFHQVRPDTRIASEGTGLGLYISREIMALHQGRLGLTSRLGEGTEVTVTFPPARLRGVELKERDTA